MCVVTVLKQEKIYERKYHTYEKKKRKVNEHNEKKKVQRKHNAKVTANAIYRFAILNAVVVVVVECVEE